MRRSKKMFVAAATAALMATGGIAYALDINADAGAEVNVVAPEVELPHVLSGAFYALGGVHNLAEDVLEEAFDKLIVVKHGVKHIAFESLEIVGHKAFVVIGGVKYVAENVVGHALHKAVVVIGGVKHLALGGLHHVAGGALHLVLGGVTFVATEVVPGAVVGTAHLAKHVVGGLLSELDGDLVDITAIVGIGLF